MTEKEKKEPGKDLEAREKALAERDQEIKELQEHLDKREAEIAEWEKALAEKGPSVAPAEPTEKPLTKEQEKLIEEGCRAYGIDKKYLFHFRIDPRTKEAVLVTNGGKKVRYAKGMEVEELDPVAVDGISRKKPRHVMGKKK